MTGTLQNALRNGRIALTLFGMWFPLARARVPSRPIMVSIDGRVERALNAYGPGPGAPFTSYDLADGRYVYNVGRNWLLRAPRRATREVTVELVAA